MLRARSGDRHELIGRHEREEGEPAVKIRSRPEHATSDTILNILIPYKS